MGGGVLLTGDLMGEMVLFLGVGGDILSSLLFSGNW